MAAACIFCKIIKGEIPSFKLFESPHILAFLDINPLSRGHALVIPKHHGEKLTDIPDEQLREILPVTKKLVLATGAENYNILQNNGRIAHQVVDHVHFHMVCPQLNREQDEAGLSKGKKRQEALRQQQIPKPNVTEGLSMTWPMQPTDMDKLKSYFEEVKAKM
ncbi:Adenosine 5'-monophosphoramidase [Xylographa opegraphella]|nr:Adenosine 5'-monophosphoramidase [Xylographa opegraphella]